MGDIFYFVGEVLGVHLAFCLCYCYISLFMDKGLCQEFTMLGLIIQTLVFGQSTMAAIRVRVWLSCIA